MASPQIGVPINFDQNLSSIRIPCREKEMEPVRTQPQKYGLLEKRTGQTMDAENPYKRPQNQTCITSMHGMENWMPHHKSAGLWLKNGKPIQASVIPERGSTTQVDPCQNLNPNGTWGCHFISGPDSKVDRSNEVIRNHCHTSGMNFSPIASNIKEEQKNCNTCLYDTGRWQSSPGSQDTPVRCSTAEDFGQEFSGSNHIFRPIIASHGNGNKDEHGNDSKAFYTGKDLYPAYLKEMDTEALLNVSFPPSGVSEWFEQPNIRDYSPICPEDGQYIYGQHFEPRYHAWPDYGVENMTVLPPTQNGVASPDGPKNGWHAFDYVCSPESSFSSQFSNSVVSDISPEPGKSSVVDDVNAFHGTLGSSSINKRYSYHTNSRQVRCGSSTDTYGPAPEEGPRRKGGRSSSQRSESRDDFLIKCKLAGMSYKEIKIKGHFSEAESTLRGRFRTLTKRKEHRVRKPGWRETDVSTFASCR